MKSRASRIPKATGEGQNAPLNFLSVIPMLKLVSHYIRYIFPLNLPSGPIWSSSRDVCVSVWVSVPFPCNSPRGAKPSPTVTSVPWKNVYPKCTSLRLAVSHPPHLTPTPTPPPFFLKSRTHILMVSVLLSASVKRFSVFHMQDFLYYIIYFKP